MPGASVERAFPIDDPRVDVPWGIGEPGFLALLRGAPVAKVAGGRYRLRCRVLDGLEGDLHFHFESRGGEGRLARVELLRTPRRHRQRAYDDVQARLERLLGPGETLTPRLALYPAPSRWRAGRLTVTHETYFEGVEYEKVLFATAGA